MLLGANKHIHTHRHTVGQALVLTNVDEQLSRRRRDLQEDLQDYKTIFITSFILKI